MTNEIHQSHKLEDVLYDIRGPVLVEAKRLEEQGHRITKLNIGNPAPFGFEAPPEILVDVVRHLSESQGYSDSQGIRSARTAIVQHYQLRGIDITDPDDIWLGNGASELIQLALNALLDEGDEVLIPAPDYPLWTASTSLAGGTPVHYLCNEDDSWNPDLDDIRSKITPRAGAIVVINQNNPTGAVASKEQLKAWVDYARANGSLILFDAAYEAFIQDPSLPHSIYEIEGARECAIEFRSFSKNAGFTGTRCALTVVPRGLMGTAANGEQVELWGLWNRRQCTKFNGVSYIVQRGAEAVYSPEGQAQVKALIAFYMENAAIIRRELSAAGLQVYGGEQAPYVWIKTPAGVDSWGFFDLLLSQANVVGTPGSGFGAAGEGYFRLSAFNSRENVLEAMRRIQAALAPAAAAA